MWPFSVCSNGQGQAVEARELLQLCGDLFPTIIFLKLGQCPLGIRSPALTIVCLNDLSLQTAFQRSRSLLSVSVACLGPSLSSVCFINGRNWGRLGFAE